MSTETPRFAQFADGTLLKQENGAYMLVADHEKQMAELRGKLERLAASWVNQNPPVIGGWFRAQELRDILNEGSK